MQRTLYAYKIEALSVNEEKCERLSSLEQDMIKVLSILKGKPITTRKYDFKQEHKIIYLYDIRYDATNRILKLVIKSAKYNAVRNVINTLTMISKGILKDSKDGDEEMNHIAFKFVEDRTAVCLYESNYYGIGFRRIMFYLQHYIKEYHRNVKDKIFYNLNYSNIISTDFLKALEKAKRIKMVTLTVDQEDIAVSDTKALAGRKDLSSDVNIVMKPATEGASINSTTVKSLYKTIYKKDKKVKRICVDADSYESVPISFDTEKMKKKIIVNVEGTGKTNEVETKSIFGKMTLELNKL